ncbi:MAG: DUF5067 domain-containing protein [Lactobacillus sp.]|jgi:hypothetical protein|nr:DUF5067 domain-containing protein [Lactobacillus sp.]
MKKVLWLTLLTTLTLTFGACGNNNNTATKSSSSSSSKTSTAQKVSSSSTATTSNDTNFKDGVLTVPEAKLKITKTQVAHNNEDNEDGLIVWYTITNQSQQNIEPEDILKRLAFHQNDGNASYTLEDDFDAAEALYSDEAEQDKFENEVEDLADNELQPGKTVETVAGIELRNTNDPVTVINQARQDQTFTINLK